MNRQAKTLIAAIGLLGLGTLFVGTTDTAYADPPRHAPAHGYRNKQDRNDRYSGRRDWRKDNDRRRDNRGWQRDRHDRDWAHDRYRDRRRNDDRRWNPWDKQRPVSIRQSPYSQNWIWRNRDSDRDGIVNYRDRFPTDRRRR
jgi:hypothetical protein